MAKLGNLVIDALHLVTLNKDGSIKAGPVELYSKIVSAVLNQSLFESSITLTLTISEAEGMLTRFNKKGILGQEFVILTAHNNHANDNPINLQFHVRSAKHAELSTQGQSVLMTLECVTKEALIDSFTSVNQSFNKTYSKTVESIWDRYIVKSPKQEFFKNTALTPFDKKAIEVHDTQQVINSFIVPGRSPFGAIDMCGRRAHDFTFGGSMFLFYETINGYYFHNIEKLINDQNELLETEPQLRSYRYSPVDDSSEGTVDEIKKIRSLDELKLPDQHLLGATGSLRNTARALDVVGKTYRDVAFDYQEKTRGAYQLVDPAGDTFIDDDFHDMFVEDTYEFLIVKDTTKRNQFYEHIVGQRMPFVHHLMSQQMNITLTGDITLVPGEMVDLEIPEQSAYKGDTQTDVSSNRLGGRWMIATVKQVFDAQENHTTILSCMKNSGVPGEK
jgi:hypothetical protein